MPKCPYQVLTENVGRVAVQEPNMDGRDTSSKGKFVAGRCYYQVLHIRWCESTSMLIQTWSYDGVVRQDHSAKDCDNPYMWYRFSLIAREPGTWVAARGIHIANLKNASQQMLTADELIARLRWLQTLGRPSSTDESIYPSD